MTALSWGVELWDQSEYLLQHENDQLVLHDQHIRLLTEIQKLVVDFGKKYRKTVAAYVPKKKPPVSPESSLSYNSFITDSLAPFLEMGQAFESYGNELLNSVITPLKSEYDKERKSADKASSDYIKHTNQREKEKKRLEEIWRNHVIALKEKQKAETANTAAQSDSNITKEEQQKAENNLTAKTYNFTDTQQTYALEMSKFNNNQRHFFSHHLWILISDLELMERKRCQVTGELVSKCADLGDALAKSLTDSATSLRRHVVRIDGEGDCKAIMEARRTEFLYPVDLPFLNLAQCTQATLDNPATLLNLMLGSTNGSTTKVSEKTPKGIHGLFGKSRNQTSDGNVLQTPFISGIGYKPVKEAEMTVLQVNERIKGLKANVDKVNSTMEATRRLLDSYTQNPGLGKPQDTEETIAKLQRQAYSLNELIKRLEARFNQMGGDQALTSAQSALECTNPYGISSPTDNLYRPNRPSAGPNRDSRTESSDGESDECGPRSAPTADYVGQATCQYDYKGEGPDFLSANAGDIFYVVGLDDDNSGWTAVVSSDGSKHGYLPTAYMDIKPY